MNLEEKILRAAQTAADKNNAKYCKEMNKGLTSKQPACIKDIIQAKDRLKTL